MSALYGPPQELRAPGFDGVGDVHGYADTLVRLLEALGYSAVDGVFRHPTRTAVFVGDFIDRGPGQREALRIARAMVAAGAARAVMGNHEFNAVGFATPDGDGGHLRPHTEKNRAQHIGFLDQIGEDSPDHRDAVAWFATLPLWLDLGGLRVVHACWSAASQAALAGWIDEDARLSPRGFAEASRPGAAAYAAVDTLLKGPEARLPGGRAFHDKDGHPRHEARLRWWDPGADTFRKSALGMAGREAEPPDLPVPIDRLYDGATPVLFGHYWMSGEPHVLKPNAACLDFSVANGAPLVAYRWSGEAALVNDNLVWVAA